MKTKTQMSLFIIYIGDARQGGGIEDLVGVFTDYDLALQAMSDVDRENGWNPDGCYGAMLEEVQPNVRIDMKGGK